MIRLITGTPGSGKTLYTVSQIMKMRQDKPDRKIYSDIKGLRIDGVEPAPDDWRDAPDGSLIIYDEVQYRQIYAKARGRNKNSMIVDLTTHRHTGKDIWLITQNPKFLHADVLAVVGEHYHIDRPMNASFANVYKWRTAQENPNGVTVRRRAENAPVFKYDKKLFDYYDSVDVDEENANHKNSLELLKNWRFLVLVGGVLLCAWAFYRIVFDGGITPVESDKSEETAVTAPAEDTPNDSIQDTIVNGNNNQNGRTYVIDEQRLNELKLQYLNDYHVTFNHDDIRPAQVITNGKECMAFNKYGDKLNVTQVQCLDLSMGAMPKAKQFTNNTTATAQPTQAEPTADQQQTPQQITQGITTTEEYLFADKSKTEPIFNPS